MIESIALFYVNYVEPAWKALLIIIAVVLLFYLLNVLRGGAAKGDLLSTIVNGAFKLLLKMFQIIGRGILSAMRSLFRTFRLLMATVRDFLFSKDL